jgi:hypothetical protein
MDTDRYKHIMPDTMHVLTDTDRYMLILTDTDKMHAHSWRGYRLPLIYINKWMKAKDRDIFPVPV